MKVFKFLLFISLLVFGAMVGIFLVKEMPKLFPWVVPEPRIIEVVKMEPGEIVYIRGKTPDPVIIETIVYKDGQVTFKQDLPYEGKVIKTDTADMLFNGVYHVDVTENKLSIEDEIIGEVQTTIRYKETLAPMNEIGVMYGSAGGIAGYYRRYFNNVLFITPWAGVEVGPGGANLNAGIAIKF
jgi:hypothetical protein